MIHQAAAHVPPAPTTLGVEPLPWAHLDIPQRMARVIERCKIGIAEAVTENDFLREPETAEISLEDLRANIGKATILVVTGHGEPTYNRAERIKHGVAALLTVMPDRATVIETLAFHNFPRAEAADLAADIVDQVADRWRGSGAALDTARDGLPDWGRRQLERNAQ